MHASHKRVSAAAFCICWSWTWLSLFFLPFSPDVNIIAHPSRFVNLPAVDNFCPWFLSLWLYYLELLLLTQLSAQFDPVCSAQSHFTYVPAYSHHFPVYIYNPEKEDRFHVIPMNSFGNLVSFISNIPILHQISKSVPPMNIYSWHKSNRRSLAPIP